MILDTDTVTDTATDTDISWLRYYLQPADVSNILIGIVTVIVIE